MSNRAALISPAALVGQFAALGRSTWIGRAPLPAVPAREAGDHRLRARSAVSSGVGVRRRSRATAGSSGPDPSILAPSASSSNRPSSPYAQPAEQLELGFHRVEGPLAVEQQDPLSVQRAGDPPREVASMRPERPLRDGAVRRRPAARAGRWARRRDRGSAFRRPGRPAPGGRRRSTRPHPRGCRRQASGRGRDLPGRPREPASTVRSSKEQAAATHAQPRGDLNTVRPASSAAGSAPSSGALSDARQLPALLKVMPHQLDFGVEQVDPLHVQLAAQQRQQRGANRRLDRSPASTRRRAR